MALEQPHADLSYEDYMALPDEGRHELLGGILLMTPAGSLRHQRLQARLIAAMEPFVRRGRLGVVYADADVVLRREAPALVVRPDLVFVGKARVGILAGANIQGTPDLVVEVLSPSNARHDAIDKRRLYESHGVREYWMVLNEVDQIEVLRLGDDGRFARPEVFEPGDALGTTLLPGFALDVAELFEPEQLD